MSHRSKLGAVALCAVLLTAGYGHAAGWDERVADGYRRAQAGDAPTATLAAPRERPRVPVHGWGEPTDGVGRLATTRGGGTASDDGQRPAEDDGPADAEPAPSSEDAPAEEESGGAAPVRAEAAPDEPSGPETPATPRPEAAESSAGSSEPERTESSESSESDEPGDPEPAAEASEPPADPAGRMAQLVADFRRQEGLAPLRRSAGLDEIARSWAQVMADEGGLRHNPDVEEQARSEHGCCRVAENVVHNQPADVDRAHRSLVESSGHRRNLAGDYQRIGIGIVIDDQDRLWGVQVFHGD